ncbi:HAD-like domain-containing protein [Mycena albidolilacea]|uniref:HAD-like domain-containing protein n=1 Tax=Mycena albidolilacea TaxID=1033008 RepID=A0AAD7A2U9_9AGAR|nr:HAD-like domain-containing protein [Mycena albidolilacea]
MATQENEDMKAFKQRMHSQIRTQLEPRVRRAKQELQDKTRRDKTKQKQFEQEFNDAIRVIEQAAMDQLKDEVRREKIRRGADGLGGWGADRSQSRLGGFAGEFGGQSPSPEWNLEGLAQQRSTPTIGHTRSRSSLGNNASLLTSSKPGSSTASAAMYANAARPSLSGSRSNQAEDTILQSTAKVIGVDEARIRKFAEEQARLERVHSPVTPIADPAIRKFAEEQARLHRAHSPELPRNETHLKFAEEQARLHRAHSPELPRNETHLKFSEEQARLHRGHSPELARNETHLKFAEEQARLLRAHSPELPRNDSKSRFTEEQARLNRAQTPDTLRTESRSRAGSAVSADAARLAAFAEQQLRAQNQFAQDTRNSSNSRLGQNSRAKPAPAPYVPTIGRQGTGTGQSLFSRFPLNEPDETTSPYNDDPSLTQVEVLFFDLDGTVLNWQGTVSEELRRLANKHFPEIRDKVDWEGFAMRWRDSYLAAIRSLAEHGDSLSPSSVYRTVSSRNVFDLVVCLASIQTLDQLLSKENKQLANRWTPTVRNQLVEIWDRGQAWPDTKDGLQAIKTIKTIATLSNMSLRTQTQMSRHAGLSWDVCLCGSLLGFYKPNPEAYLEAARSMTLPVSKCAVVSAHVDELQAAGNIGMKTIYMRRPSEDRDVEAEVLSKLDGGEFDLVVDSFEHLAIVLGCDD